MKIESPGTSRHAARPRASLHRFAPYRDDAFDADALASGFTLLAMLCGVCVMLGSIVARGIGA